MNAETNADVQRQISEIKSLLAEYSALLPANKPLTLSEIYKEKNLKIALSF